MTKQENWYSNPTQVHWCCKALIESRTISHKTEIREVKGWRLDAVIPLLKSKYCWPVIVEYLGSENVARYRLQPGTAIATLAFPPSAADLAEAGQA